MKFLFFIVFLMIPELVFSATSYFYSCTGNQANSVVNIRFTAGSPSENYVTLITSHEYRGIQYLYATPMRFSMRTLTDSSGTGTVQVVGFWTAVNVSDVQCSPESDNNNQVAQIASLIIGGFAAIAFVLAISARFRGRV